MSDILLTMWQDHLTCIGIIEGKVQFLSICDKPERNGNVYVGRVEHKVENLNAVFVRFEKTAAKSSKHGIGFLPIKSVAPECILNRSVEISTEIKSGDLVLVQVKTEEQKTKQAKLTGKPKLLKNEYGGSLENLINAAKMRTEYQLLVNRNGTLVDKITDCISEFSKIAGISFDDALVICDIKSICDELDSENIRCYYYDEEEKRISLSVMYSLMSKTDGLTKKKVWLSSGGYLIVEQTETLNLIDVNSGKNLNKSDDFIFEINKEAAIEAFRQIRLRNLTGMILIDFISMKDKIKEAEFIAFTEELIKNDSLNMRYIDMTGLGIMEFTRDKCNKSLRELLDLYH